LATDSSSDFDEFTAAQKPDHDEDDNNEDDNNIHNPAPRTKLVGAIPRDAIVQLFKDKTQRPKKKQKIAEAKEGDVIIVD
jgi:regulator of RNase E activity RraA